MKPARHTRSTLCFVERRHHQLVVGFALEPLRRNHLRGNSALRALLEARRAFAIADHEGDFRVGNASGGDAIGQRLEIRAAPATAARQCVSSSPQEISTVRRLAQNGSQDDSTAVSRPKCKVSVERAAPRKQDCRARNAGVSPALLISRQSLLNAAPAHRCFLDTFAHKRHLLHQRS